jgi:hypothetical protein
VARWKIISGARPFYEFPGRVVAVGWARDLERGETQVTVNVVVLRDAQEASDLPQDSRDAIRSHGRSVINSLLNEDTLPTIVEVRTTGLERIYPRSEEDLAEGEDEDEDEDEEAEEAEKPGEET